MLQTFSWNVLHYCPALLDSPFHISLGFAFFLQQNCFYCWVRILNRYANEFLASQFTMYLEICIDFCCLKFFYIYVFRPSLGKYTKRAMWRCDSLFKTDKNLIIECQEGDQSQILLIIDFLLNYSCTKHSMYIQTVSS